MALHNVFSLVFIKNKNYYGLLFRKGNIIHIGN